MAETGLFGLIGYFFLIYFLTMIVYKTARKKDLLPFYIPVLVALFPFNAHMAFYGSIWSSVCWILIALFFAKENTIKQSGHSDALKP